MSDKLDDLDRWESEFERRSIGRTKIVKGALLFFSERTGVQSCIVRDVTKVGAGIRAQELTVVPLEFALSFDNFRTIRMCRLIWRQDDFLGLARLSQLDSFLAIFDVWSRQKLNHYKGRGIENRCSEDLPPFRAFYPSRIVAHVFAIHATT